MTAQPLTADEADEMSAALRSAFARKEWGDTTVLTICATYGWQGWPDDDEAARP
jgi:hypothetical protein